MWKFFKKEKVKEKEMGIGPLTLKEFASVYARTYNISQEEAEKKVIADDKFLQKITNLRPITAEILFNNEFKKEKNVK